MLFSTSLKIRNHIITNLYGTSHTVYEEVVWSWKDLCLDLDGLTGFQRPYYSEVVFRMPSLCTSVYLRMDAYTGAGRETWRFLSYY
jgi:hypothetical protein